jgi:hypothetical protein
MHDTSNFHLAFPMTQGNTVGIGVKGMEVRGNRQVEVLRVTDGTELEGIDTRYKK